jgi:2-dehydro-3-deoxygluconokinase
MRAASAAAYWRSASAARDMLGGPRRAGRRGAHRLISFISITLSILDPPQRAALVAITWMRATTAGWRSTATIVGRGQTRAARAAFDQISSGSTSLPTLDDEQALFGVKDARESAERLHRLGVAEAAIKLGQAGCFLSSAQFTGAIPTETVVAQIMAVVHSAATARRTHRRQDPVQHP